MPFVPTDIPDLLVFEPVIHQDNRGYFFESYNEEDFSREGLRIKFVQDNQARSGFGVLRGLHYQLEPYAQTKLIRVLEGEILDVAVDIRQGSPAYGQSFCLVLSAGNKKQLLVPKGFAHGYAVLSHAAEVFYKCDNFYNKTQEAGILYNDPDLDIDWQIRSSDTIISEKDQVLPPLKQARNNFSFRAL
ncbi:MAG TPA: dTDP-4-dehydrorhamnose 3,5-epimerase [Chitinophagaceae bacterium]|nr:dTDP-4-dehydrorhamnose 3,5-epimerase [Chitinophagaceae bacterium]